MPFISPEFKRIEAQLTRIDSELKSLPKTREIVWGYRHGHRSADLDKEDRPDWIQLDLKIKRRIDTLALVPAHLAYQGEPGDGHGFPLRFRVELSDDPDMKDAVTLVDCSREDVINPRKNPLVLKVPPTEGRYLRFTSLKHLSENQIYFWALEELIALDGNNNVARSTELTMSSSMDLFPIWSPVRLVDGQHSLGMPVDVTQPSPSIGYLSRPTPFISKDVGPLRPGEEKWFGVDLGSTQAIEQIRLLPLESDEYHVFGGRGFPREFTVQISEDPEFKSLAWESWKCNYPFGYPAGCSITMPLPQIRARYIRILATRLWSRDSWQALGLAELQVYSGGINVARNKRVFVKDQTDLPPSSGWAPEYLVDGFTSRYRLVEWPEFLAMFDKKTQLECEMKRLIQLRHQITESSEKIVIGLACIFSVLLTAALAWLWKSQQQMRLQAVEQLRQQIARDLHDDIGSNLGGIILVSEIGSEQSANETSRRDFDTIREAAEEASNSMRDIVWLVQRQETGIKDMIARMRDAATMILRNTDVEFTIEPSTFKDHQLSLLFRRHVFFSFKEIINNIRKHASASQVTVNITVNDLGIRFQISDNGVGFNPGTQTNDGHGLGNLEQRAQRISGSIKIHSRLGQGTQVIFEAPYQQ